MAQEVGNASPAVGLSQFVKGMKGTQPRVIEMRVVAFAGAFLSSRILLSKDVQEPCFWSVFMYLISCIAVLLFSTWLVYFPTTIKTVKLRGGEGQGIAVGCLFLQLVLCGMIHCAVDHAPQLLGLLSFNLSILTGVCAVSLLATLLYPIAFPNSVTLYNFALFGVALALYWWMDVPFFPMLGVAVLYSVLVALLLQVFPGSFTVCEAMLVSQGTALLVLDSLMQLLAGFGFMKFPPDMSVTRSSATSCLEMLMFGLFLCCVLLFPVLFFIYESKREVEEKLWSTVFQVASLGLGFFLVLPCLQLLLNGASPIPFVLASIFGQQHTVLLSLYWTVLLVGACLLLCSQSSSISLLSTLKNSEPSSIWMRKWFHLLVFLVFLVGLAVDPDFVSLSSSGIAFLLVGFELIRVFHMWPLATFLDPLVEPVLDSRDSGPLVLTHIYLLFGFSLPVWLYPLKRYTQVSKLSMYGGVLALGIGDSVAAVAGQLMGRQKWPGTTKTVEGTLMSFFTQMLGVLVILVIDPELDFFMITQRQWGVIASCIGAASFLEAYTQQIDNLIIGVFLFAILLGFL